MNREPPAPQRFRKTWFPRAMPAPPEPHPPAWAPDRRCGLCKAQWAGRSDQPPHPLASMCTRWQESRPTPRGSVCSSVNGAEGDAPSEGGRGLEVMHERCEAARPQRCFCPPGQRQLARPLSPPFLFASSLRFPGGAFALTTLQTLCPTHTPEPRGWEKTEQGCRWQSSRVPAPGASVPFAA